jgi:hypothetical protein
MYTMLYTKRIPFSRSPNFRFFILLNVNFPVSPPRLFLVWFRTRIIGNRFPSAQAYLDPLESRTLSERRHATAGSGRCSHAGLWNFPSDKIKLTNRRMLYNGPNHTYLTRNCIRYVRTLVSFPSQERRFPGSNQVWGLSLPIRPFYCFAGQGLFGTDVVYVLVPFLFQRHERRQSYRMNHVGCCVKM